LKNSSQSVHDVFLYRVKHHKKDLIVDFLYELARIIDEKISNDFIIVIIKKMTTIIIKLQKEIKKRVALQNQTIKKMMKLQTLH
jgi:hypothetical protein